nr:ribonuclease H-like domain-containing protein [Tanacetum cinerariifolium]
MWLFKHKFYADRTVSRYKARLVANDSSQLLGVDFDERFSPVVKSTTIYTVLSLVVPRQWPIHQFDVKNAFLNGDVSETVYMHQPSGFVDNRYPQHVCFLQRSLYGLKQALRAWFHGLQVTYLLIYVDDIIFTASCLALLQQIIGSLNKEFDMTDLGELNYFLGISADRTPTGLFLSQKKYALQLLKPSFICILHYLSAWLRNLLYELHSPLSTETLVYFDNVRVLHVPSRFQYADIFTNGLPFMILNGSSLLDVDAFLLEALFLACGSVLASSLGSANCLRLSAHGLTLSDGWSSCNKDINQHQLSLLSTFITAHVI